MFGIGMPELIVILVIALLIFGPEKLPELAKSIGKGFANFKKTADDIKDSIEDEMTRLEEDKKMLEEEIIEEEKPPESIEHEAKASKQESESEDVNKKLEDGRE